MAQAISTLAGNTILWYSIVVGIFIGMMGVGSLSYRRIFNEWSSIRVFIYIELALVLIGGAGVIVVNISHMLSQYLFFHGFFMAAQTIFPIWSITVVALIGFFTGIELPLLMQIMKDNAPQKRTHNRVLAADYVGSLAGAVLFPLALLPFFEITTIGFIAASFNLAVVMFVLLKYKYGPCGQMRNAVIVVFILIAALANGGHISGYFTEKYYSAKNAHDISELFAPKDSGIEIIRTSSPYQKIDVVKGFREPREEAVANIFTKKYIRDPKYPRNVSLYLNGDFQLFSDIDEMYHEWFAHVPIILNESVPENILVLGAGDGILDKELLKYAGVKHIVHVDIDRKIIELAKTSPDLLHMNRGSLADKRIEIVIEDAFSFIQKTSGRFDAVYIDLPNPNSYDLSRLYSREFYVFVKKLLNENGFIALDAPGTDPVPSFNAGGGIDYLVGPKWSAYYNTLKSSGFETIIPYRSITETDNEDILNAAKKFVSGNVAPEFIDIEAKAILNEHALSVSQSFIFAKASKIGDIAYWETGASFDALNKLRFNISFLSYPEPEFTDWKQVNSIARPTIFDISAWKVRYPH